ncbi:MAG TPA: glycosyltransferase family 9 protein [Vicinamibacterales bacterium]|nr:glycosyltransferase family 9 protein [Vicinamibacterales bacterium]
MTPKLLFVRLGSLGDIIHTVPAVAAVRGAMPRAEIHWLVDARHIEVLELVEGIDRIHPIKPTAPGWVSAIGALRREQFDAALDFQGLVKSATLARLSGSRRAVGFARASLREPAAAALYHETVTPGADGHVIGKNLSLLRALDIQAPAAPSFPFARRPSAALQQVRTQAGERFAIINPGAAWPNKRWPPERFGALAGQLRERHALPSIAIWGPGELEIAETLVRESGGAAALAPLTSIADLFALAGAASLMVSGDTGPLHIAAAAGTPIVGIYGPTDPARNGPWSPHDVCVSRFAACGCHHLRRCVQARWCLDDVALEEVAQAVDRRLAGVAAR